MKICYIANSIIPSRTANSVHVMKMCQAFSKLGHDVTLVIPENSDGIEPGISDVFEYYGIEHRFSISRYSSFRPLKFWKSIVMPRRAVRQTNADLYYSRIVWSGWGLATIFRRPTIIEMHDVPSEGSTLARCYRATIARSKLLRVVAITQALFDKLSDLPLRENICLDDKVIVAPDGVDERLVNNKLSQSDACHRLGLAPTEGLRVVYAGHLYPGRGIEIVVELANRHPNIQFLVVGGREQDIERWQSATRDRNNLDFAGHVAPRIVFSYLRAADVLLMPYAHVVSHSGGGNTADICSPMKMFEYLAAGRPIISSDLPVLQEVLRSESNCLIAEYQDLDSWSIQLNRLQGDPQLRLRLGENARCDAAKYTWEKRAGNILSQIELG